MAGRGPGRALHRTVVALPSLRKPGLVVRKGILPGRLTLERIDVACALLLTVTMVVVLIVTPFLHNAPTVLVMGPIAASRS